MTGNHCVKVSMTCGLLLSDGVDVDPVAVVVVVVEVVGDGRDTDLLWKHQMVWKR